MCQPVAREYRKWEKLIKKSLRLRLVDRRRKRKGKKKNSTNVHDPCSHVIEIIRYNYFFLFLVCVCVRVAYFHIKVGGEHQLKWRETLAKRHASFKDLKKKIQMACWPTNYDDFKGHLLRAEPVDTWPKTNGEKKIKP